MNIITTRILRTLSDFLSSQETLSLGGNVIVRETQAVQGGHYQELHESVAEIGLDQELLSLVY